MTDQVTSVDGSQVDDPMANTNSAYEQGYRAFYDDVAFEWCPYAPGRASYSEWARGWIQAEVDRFGE